MQDEGAVRQLSQRELVNALLDNASFLVLGRKLVAGTSDGYEQRRAPSLRGVAYAITPPSTIAVLSGYAVQIGADAQD